MPCGPATAASSPAGCCSPTPTPASARRRWRGRSPPPPAGAWTPSRSPGCRRRAAWQSCGGFETVRHAAVDDVAMAALLRRHGYRTGFFRAPDLLSVRMYQGFREATRGWRRNLGGLLGLRPGLTLAALAGLAAPALALAAALAAGSFVAAALLWGAGAATSALLRTGSGNRPAYALLYPLDAVLLAGVLAAGVRDHRRGRLLSWKGREMRL